MKPSVVGVVGDFVDLSLAEGLEKEEIDFVEIRADLFSVDELDELEGRVANLEFPLIITYRDPSEGGKGEFTTSSRVEIFRRFMRYASFVDIETKNLGEFPAFCHDAREEGIAIIGSHHQLKRFSPGRAWHHKEIAEEAEVDIFKLAVRINNPHDFSLLVEMSKEKSGGPHCSTMCIGELGRASRIIFAALGSVLNYGSLGSAVVPGQWPALKLKQMLAEL